MKQWLALAKQAGFSQAAPLEIAALKVREEVRAMCAADRCHRYGKSWSCPPACGTLEQCPMRITHYTGGILVQTTGNLSDPFDLEGMGEIEKRHKASFATLARQMRLLCPDCLP